MWQEYQILDLKNKEIYDTNSLNSSWTKESFRKKAVEKIKTHSP